MLLCLSASRIYNTFSISIGSRKRNKAVGLYPFWFTQVEVLALCYYAWALLGYIKRVAFRFVAETKIRQLFYILSGSSRYKSCLMLSCLSASRIYNTFSILIRSRKKTLGSCSISFLLHPDRSPGMMFLFLSASRIYSKFSISILIQKKNISLLFYTLSGSPW